MEPVYVRDYIRAPEWLFFHYGLPLLAVLFCCLIGWAFVQWLDDLRVNDDSPRKSTKILDL